jgi:predicted DsbA family dithiol-disulfide isomerase
VKSITEPAGEAIRIDVVSDVVCPWCYVGKRQLESALHRWTSLHGDAPAPVVRWWPFQLNPDLPQAGVERSEYLRAKFGQADPAAIYQRVADAARAVGLKPDFERISRQPNTARAHALIEAAIPGEQQQALVETLFRAYFVEGADLTSRDALARFARQAGLPDALVERSLDDEEALAGVRQAERQARALGVSGVPFFVIDGRRAVSGAQGAEALLAAMGQVRGG